MRRWVRALLWIWVVALCTATLFIPFSDVETVDYFLLPAPLTMVLGALILTKVPGNRIGLVMLVGGSTWLIYVFSRQYAQLSQLDGPFPGEYLAAWLGNWIGPFFLLSFPTLLVLFPSGEADGWRRWFLGFLGLVAALAVAGAVALWGADITVLTQDDIADVSPEYALTDLAFLLGLWSALPATLAVVGRYRRGNGLERQQIKWLMVGAALLAITLLLAPILEGSEVWGAALAVGMSMFPVAIGIAVFRYRLYDLGRLVSRTVSYAIVVSVLGLLFVVGVVLIPDRILLVDDPPTLLVAGSTLAAAALFNPLRKWAQRWVDRRFNRSHYDAAQVMDEFAGSLRERVETEDVVDGWMDVVDRTMQPSAVGVWMRE